MTVRYRRRVKPSPPTLVFDPDPKQPPSVEIETYAERLCACTCGHRWFAEVGTVTRCPGSIAWDRCPAGSKPFEVLR